MFLLNVKVARLRRIIDQGSNRSVIIPLDHGITYGQLNGIQNLRKFVYSIEKTDVDALIMHKGMLQNVVDILPRNIATIMHLSGSVNFSFDSHVKVLVGSVKEAIQLGADGVSIHVNMGCKDDSRMLSDLGKISEQCNRWNMPLLVMMYPIYSKNEIDEKEQLRITMHSIRICEELGADMVKVACIPGMENMKELIQSVHIPILIAGGEKMEEAPFLNRIISLMDAGISGVTIGRNIFQSECPEKIIGKICDIVHKC